MRKSMWIILTVLFAAVGAPSAHADSQAFTANFTVDASSQILAPPEGGGVYDTATGCFSAFGVSWDGDGFDLQFCVANPSSVTLEWSAFALVDENPQTFSFEADGGTDTKIEANTCFFFPPCPSENGSASGTFTLTPIPATPEPATGGLMLLGTGFVLAVRKRIC